LPVEGARNRLHFTGEAQQCLVRAENRTEVPTMVTQRKRMPSINKYQWRILLLVLTPPVLILSALALLSNLFFDQLLAAVQSGSPTTLMDFLADWRLNFLLILWALLTLVVVITYVVSRNMLGPFSRLLREMDQVLAGERGFGPLKARQHDELANELLQRINRLTGRTRGPG
jgi:hypothetical protein